MLLRIICHCIYKERNHLFSIMKSHKRLFEKLLDKDFIRSCIIDAAKHKTKRSDVMHVLKNIDYYVDWLFDLLKNGEFHIHNKQPRVINEHNCNKERVIICPDFMPDLVVQHMVIKVLQPLFINHFYYNSCASIPNRGPNYGRKAIQRFIRRNHLKRMYVFKFDIRRFFEHIDRNILMDKFVKLIHDDAFLYIIHQIIFYNDNDIGIPLGFYSSQWFANFYLTEFDYYTKQSCRIPFMMRYMDDIIILDFNKRHLWESITCVIDFLLYRLHLVIKKNYQMFLLNDGCVGRCIDYMGFKFYHNRVILRKRTLCRLRRKSVCIYKKYISCYRKPNWYVCTQMIARHGLMAHVDCYLYFLKYIKSNIQLKRMRLIISSHSKYMNMVTCNTMIQRSCA